ncbi:hypothetical protein BUALT_Bualt03G0202200 [Buddleja alternifolia]|uniref:B-like cyclin n=1 Tax=Buddleja alternifolia TaxID=168488 RepID=A0AAV6Y1W4_9LAMI|nr:hypothetical protein BUALT_Bualt03G0202200 [Buddleja alternifolia]
MPEGKPWVSKVVAISCVSLALKMKKAKFSVSYLLNDGGFIHDSFTIERMEMLILGALNWRMRSVNPFSFANYFMSFFGFNDEPLIRALKDRAAEIILNAQNDIKLLEFKPSVISASALLSATYELFPFELPYFRDAISPHDIMQDAASEGYVPLVEMTSSLCTPSNVLDLHCLSYSISSSQTNQMSRTTNSVGAIAGLTDQTIEDSQLIGEKFTSIERNITDEQKTVGEVRERDPF